MASSHQMSVLAAGYSPLQQETTTTTRNTRQIPTGSWWQLLKDAAKSVYGPEILVLQTDASVNELEQFVANLEFTVSYSDPEPKRTRPTIIDITVKEYINHGDKEQAQTMLKVSKTSSVTKGTRYYFTTSHAIDWAFNDNIGAQIVGLSMAGGRMRVGGGYVASRRNHKTIQDTTVNSGVQFVYSQEEQLIVPPRTKTTAKITTSTIRYEQKYVLELSTPSSTTVRILFKTKFQQMCDCFRFCCCKCYTTGYVRAGDILRTMPDYGQSNGRCYFTQAGVLSWIGEDCSVEKTDEVIELYS